MALLAWAAPAASLDLFTLWHAAAGSLSIAPGDRVDYRNVTIEQGRRRTELVRLQCVGEDGGHWLLELLPLREGPDGLHPLPGEGWRLELAKTAATARGGLDEHVGRVVHWLEGEPRTVDAAEWREDPLLQASLAVDFHPESREVRPRTTRVVAGRDLLCDQMVLVDRDTSRVELPRGVLLQIHVREVSASYEASVPFLGVVHAAERAETRASVEPAGSRPLPPPRVRVETMELVDFGRDAVAWLGRG